MAYHQPVLLDVILKYLQPQPDQDYIDCTIGGAGHAEAILTATAPNGQLLGIDLDLQAVEAAKARLKKFGSRVQLAQANFADLQSLASQYGFNQVSGILFDLGLSSDQLADQKRGFSFQFNGPLDMRFGPGNLTAAKIVNQYSEKQLAEIFQNFGEERSAWPIAKAIVQARKRQKINQTKDLVKIIDQIYHCKQRPKKIHPATKVFQALRLEVNQELENLQLALPQAVKLLAPGGRLAVISFHSLEDRIVKRFFRQESQDCLCPKEFLRCLCQHKKSLKIITKKPITPNLLEKTKNSRSRSSKLRLAQKI